MAPSPFIWPPDGDQGLRAFLSEYHLQQSQVVGLNCVIHAFFNSLSGDVRLLLVDSECIRDNIIWEASGPLVLGWMDDTCVKKLLFLRAREVRALANRGYQWPRGVDRTANVDRLLRLLSPL